MNLLIRSARLWQRNALQQADLLLQNGIIAKIGTNLNAGETPVWQADGCLLAPGFTDLHVHLRQPGFEEKETIATGTAAAAAGGFTTVCSMPNLAPVPDSPQHLAPQREAIQKDARVRVLPYGALTVDEKGARIADIEALSPCVCGFSDDGRGVQSEEIMAGAMRRVAAAGSFVAAHCEVEALIAPHAVCVQQNSAFARKHGFPGVSAESEWAEVQRDIELAAETGCRLHICHTSTRQSFELVRSAKARGLPVSCEVTPHNVLFSCDDITQDDGRFKMNPPLRTEDDRLAALEALLDGTADAIATDHAPHTQAQKAGGFAASLNGVVGLETAFAALYTGLVLPGLLPLERLLALLIEGPRQVLGEAPNTLQPGRPANLVLLDLEDSRVVDPAAFQTKGRATPFAGQTLRGWPVLTLYNGRAVWQNNRGKQ